MLATLSDLEAYLALPAGNGDEALLTQLILRASALFESLTGRAFTPTSYTESYDGKGSPYLALNQTPVSSVLSVTLDGQPMQPAAFQVPGYTLRQDALVLTGGLVFTRDLQNVSVSYIAGLNTIPNDIQMAVLELAAFLYRERGHLGESSKGMAGASTAYITAALPDRVGTVVNNWKRVAPL